MRGDTERHEDRSTFFETKIAHAGLNQSDLKRAMKKNTEMLDRKFLRQDTVNGMGQLVLVRTRDSTK